MLVPFRQMWLSESNIDGFFLSSLILQIGLIKNPQNIHISTLISLLF